MTKIPSLQYVNMKVLEVGKCHPIWLAVRNNSSDSRRAQLKCKLLTCIYILKQKTKKNKKQSGIQEMYKKGVKLKQINPSRHATLRQGCINVDATSCSCVDVDAMLCKPHVSTGNNVHVNSTARYKSSA